MNEGFCLLVRASQKPFPVKCPKNMAVDLIGDIKMSIKRKPTDLQIESYMPIISSKDSSFLWKIIRDAHVDTNK